MLCLDFTEEQKLRVGKVDGMQHNNLDCKLQRCNIDYIILYRNG